MKGYKILAYARCSGPLSRERSLSCHTCYDTGRSHPKDRPIQSPLTTHEGMWRLYSNPDPHEGPPVGIQCFVWWSLAHIGTFVYWPNGSQQWDSEVFCIYFSQAVYLSATPALIWRISFLLSVKMSEKTIWYSYTCASLWFAYNADFTKNDHHLVGKYGKLYECLCPTYKNLP
jgi:hypothetical protein